MDWSNRFADRMRENVALANLTWFRLGGAARYILSPRSVEELCAAMRDANAAGIPVRVLGGGANLLVSDAGFAGLVIRLDAPAFTGIERDGARWTAGGGVDLMDLARESSYGGFAGLECLAGIPGTIGGAIAMNAGGRFGAIADVVERVTLVDETGTLSEHEAADMAFGYRTSAVGRRVVIAVTLALMPAEATALKARFQEIMQYKKESQPLAAHSAGCMFKNPAGDSAGRLIDASGYKGARRGRARVSAKHANFIVADEGATADDVLALAREVRSGVQEKTGIELEYEVDIW